MSVKLGAAAFSPLLKCVVYPLYRAIETDQSSPEEACKETAQVCGSPLALYLRVSSGSTRGLTVSCLLISIFKMRMHVVFLHQEQSQLASSGFLSNILS